MVPTLPRHRHAVARRVLLVLQPLLMLSLELVYITLIPPQLELLLLHSMSTGQLSLTNRASLVTAVNEELEIAAGAATVEGASEGVSLGAGSR